MTAKHTPGEWYYVKWDDGDNAIVTKEGDGRICEMLGNQSPEQTDANGYLMAVAPEMLEMCSDWLLYINLVGETIDLTEAEKILKKRTETAIRKARGE